MEDDEDDFYGGGGGDGAGDAMQEEQPDNNAEVKDDMDVSEEAEDDDDDDDDDDSDDDVQFTLERPDGSKAEPPPGSKAAKAHKKDPASKAGAKIEADKSSNTPVKKEEAPRAGSAALPTAVKGTLTHNGKEGKDFPAIRTTQMDVNQIPMWTNGKPITAVDIDADLAEHSKPWRLPGTDQTDYFNYGFDEYTWTQYSLRQQEMSGTINQLKQNDAQMKAMLGLGGQQQQQGGMPPMPPMPPEMMGMDPQMMAQQMGIPVEMVQQFMQSGGMPPGMGGPQGGQQNFNQQGGFGNDNGPSPQPQAAQGFQPPQGPGQMSMEGLSPQQMAIFQQEQQQQMGGGHRGGRNRRGRW